MKTMERQGRSMRSLEILDKEFKLYPEDSREPLNVLCVRKISLMATWN